MFYSKKIISSPILKTTTVIYNPVKIKHSRYVKAIDVGKRQEIISKLSKLLIGLMQLDAGIHLSVKLAKLQPRLYLSKEQAQTRLWRNNFFEQMKNGEK